LKRFSMFVAVLFFLPTMVQAEDRALSLKEAIRLALARNNLIKAAEYEKTAAQHGVSVSRSRYFPRIFLDESFAASNSPTRVFMMKLDEGRFTQNDFLINNLNQPSSTADFRTAFTLEQPLLDLNIGYGTEIAETEAAEKDLALERRGEEVGFTVFASYVEVQKARAILDTAKKAVRDAEEHRRLAKVRNEAGTGLKSDELRAGTFLAEMEQQEITAKNNVLLAGMRLALATGGQAGETLGIRGTISGMTFDVSSEDIATIAFRNRKDLQETEKEVKKAEVGVKMAGSAFLPTVYANATYQMNDRDIPFGRDNDGWIVGANLRWELFDAMRRFDERARSRALRNSAREYLEQQKKEIALQVRESLLRRDEAAKRLEVARASYADAEEGLRLITKRYTNSLATLVEVLDAQTALNRARVNVVENETGYALATARIWHAAGIFLKEVMK
jgi:outer membrane protein